MSSSAITWRQELFFKSHSQLQTLIPFLHSQGIKRVNIPNKNEADQLLDSVKTLISAGILDICVHYSIKNQPKAGGPRSHHSPKAAVTEGHKQFMKFMRDLKDIEKEAMQLGLNMGTLNAAQQVPQLSILLVSGGGKKKAYNTVSALQETQKEIFMPDVLKATSEPALSRGVYQHQHSTLAVPSGCRPKRGRTELLERPEVKSHAIERSTEPGCCFNASGLMSTISKPFVPILVAFNPYLPDPEDLQKEYNRLKQKLNSGVPTGIYLQCGTDIAALEKGLQHIREALTGSSSASPTSLPVIGSVLVPTKRLLAQMKFRPWNGVFLSDRKVCTSTYAFDMMFQYLCAT
ncbi:hypothetical protein CEUSTIGMA_g13268.t1 [Chlamydomonas eustigma]|uniref:Methylenetetrahydrofolate reductase (NAD(P)H) n=1 Tax=Chlamydomonas eustigma TaxID=1157962 RepID=A0A250XS57_9CHLO|nr:hypothetical protein CEUSTIGMA_g13268.t1 [Chlamydomonas eustigma]|eukprot:GAX85853.1 hypothetical protein CEUSTIGMA_g13268.t1 [Chlamydomonas eustigma]